jgi:hypothetical protein
VPFSFPSPRAFCVRAIQAYAPCAPGLFGLSNARKWILIQQADNIQDALLRLVSERNGMVNGLNATGFVFEPCEIHAQAARQDWLVLEYEPVANRLMPYATAAAD